MSALLETLLTPQQRHDAEAADAQHSMAQCPSCYGRGYKPQARKGGGPGFYARTCQRCGGSGQIEEYRLRKSERPTPLDTAP